MNYKIKLTIWYIQRFFFNPLSFFYMFIPFINYTYDRVDFIYDYFLLITLFYIIMIIRTSHNKPIELETRTWGNGDRYVNHV